MMAPVQSEPDEPPSEGATERSQGSIVTWALVATGICTWTSRLEPNLLEKGLILHLAQRIVGGEVLFLELASFTGPLPFDLLALLFRVFGEEIEVARGGACVARAG